MKTDRKRRLFFVSGGVLLSIVVLVGLVILLVSVVLRKGYQSEDGPEAVAYNYLMALVKQDYDRAYGYLSPGLPQHPETVETFVRDLEQHLLLPIYELDPCVYIEQVEMDGHFAIVELRMQYYDPCLRGLDTRNLSYNPAQMRLEQVEGSWQIVDAKGYFFYGCWSRSDGCE